MRIWFLIGSLLVSGACFSQENILTTQDNKNTFLVSDNHVVKNDLSWQGGGQNKKDSLKKKVKAHYKAHHLSSHHKHHRRNHKNNLSSHRKNTQVKGQFIHHKIKRKNTRTSMVLLVPPISSLGFGNMLVPVLNSVQFKSDHEQAPLILKLSNNLMHQAVEVNYLAPVSSSINGLNLAPTFSQINTQPLTSSLGELGSSSKNFSYGFGSRNYVVNSSLPKGDGLNSALIYDGVLFKQIPDHSWKIFNGQLETDNLGQPIGHLLQVRW